MSYSYTSEEEQQIYILMTYVREVNISLEEYLKLHIPLDKLIRSQMKSSSLIDEKGLQKLITKAMKDNQNHTNKILQKSTEEVSKLRTEMKAELTNLFDMKMVRSDQKMEEAISKKLVSFKDTITSDGSNTSGITNFVKGELDPVKSNMSSLKDDVKLVKDGVSSTKDDMKTLKEVITHTSTQITQLNDLFTGDNKKGKSAEKVFTYKLQNIYGEENIHNISNEKHGCDIGIYLLNRPPVLLEIKNYSYTVPTTEVTKFLSDCDSKLCCGILASINTGIAKKDHFSFDIKENRITVYLHYTNYQTDVISMALTVIYGLHDIFIKKFGGNFHKTITEDDFIGMKNEYQNMLGVNFNIISNLKKLIIDAESQTHMGLDKFFSKMNTQNIINGVQKEHTVIYTCPGCKKAKNSEIKHYTSTKLFNFQRHMKEMHKITIDKTSNLDKYSKFEDDIKLVNEVLINEHDYELENNESIKEPVEANKEEVANDEIYINYDADYTDVTPANNSENNLILETVSNIKCVIKL